MSKTCSQNEASLSATKPPDSGVSSLAQSTRGDLSAGIVVTAIRFISMRVRENPWHTTLYIQTTCLCVLEMCRSHLACAFGEIRSRRRVNLSVQFCGFRQFSDTCCALLCNVLKVGNERRLLGVYFNKLRRPLRLRTRWSGVRISPGAPNDKRVPIGGPFVILGVQMKMRTTVR
jgi:hypothetical protein